MLQCLTLAFRNILRNRRRSLVTILTAALGVSAMLIFGGYSNSVIKSVATGSVRHYGHLQVQRKNYFLYGTGSPAEYGIADYGKIIGVLKADPELRPVLRIATPALQFQGIAGHFAERVSQTVSGTGLVAGEQNQMRLWNEHGTRQVTKPVPLPLDEPDAASIGIGLARILRLEQALSLPGAAAPARPGIKPGASAPDDLSALVDQEASVSGPGEVPDGGAGAVRLDLLAATATGAPNVASLKVAATESLGVKEADDRYIALHLPLAQRLVYGHGEPQVTSIILQLERSGQLEAARDRVQRIIQQHGWDLEVLDHHTLNPSSDQIQALFKSILGFFAILIGTIILFSVASVMSNAVIERTVEIGTLRAMGMRRSGLSSLFLTEGALLGALGTCLGCVWAALLALAINGAGLTWTPPNYSEKVPLVIELWDDPGIFLQAIVGLSLLSLVSALLPARRAGRIPVVEALRHV